MTVFLSYHFVKLQHRQMAKLNDRLHKERLGSSNLKLSDVFLEIHLYDPTSTFLELEKLAQI